ncbi:XdhC family protein [Desulfoscipio gibsoniae]|uniref:Xanthine and CO dehydrogenases maturation factor, XdhC/CoxF family n=1 Tax=Desulfoscipio gibsoniae DSM 7213 TaxID=767817 RepID=R4KKR0_9FIRM|nr:XdhC/CoxI family protein [Desulfoscipio gibsoniae]AGL03249.1 xanthine and CO dehydrogenases maturation factor, XdhC/CoxF family [Desulfoscipio gibsoniae DSM 7213]
MSIEMIKKLIFALDSGQDGVLAVITGATGSTPRKAGTKMIVTADYNIYGTIGGGVGEEIVRRECLKALAMKSSFEYTIKLTGNVAANEGMICGGNMDIFINYVSKDDEYAREVLTRYVDSTLNDENPALVTLTGINGEDNARLGRMMVVWPDGSVLGDLGSGHINSFTVSSVYGAGKNNNPRLIVSPPDQDIKMQLFIDPGVLNPEILILGGGHIALPLVKIASLLGFKVIVVDDRPEFANDNRFPEAYMVVCAGFEQALADMDIGPGTYTVIVTRGHAYDRDCLREVIKRPGAYVGMIGSSRKVKAIMQQLAEEGIPPEKLAAVYSPIGLEIGAQTPEEIALCIMAEVVNVYRGGGIQRKKMQ